ncbi:class II aldolase/adducin family protein [Actinotignum timonense]|uniref:class II aldolase/adducin family protein n=1 Tax=Actinotignum TaxID=1653174 RepID=UPI00254ABFF3|nr:class II aldolase/adducin family protein [Actinotignum timonense]MDK6590209.1 class II aldolase/adducin family protein [Actinotignum timonense]MDK6628925.1 class II aldolase/adducin family protein [Actinotignum timonense]MDK6907227.1 class II aldolase/adducin family protein [Actinotignum timonense]MDK8781958.1 class II aldolase/adducin family protein [Actinotignum timonense]MDY5138741.1 class II aldolase/adducin family protein [Actinotignum timonense]
MSALTISDIFTQMGEAGARLDHLAACEAGAGNISVATREPLPLDSVFPEKTAGVSLPWSVPGLAGYTVFVTGSGVRLREIEINPLAAVSAFVIDEGGATGTWWTHPERQFTKPTSEFNSHLAVHESQVRDRQVPFQVLIHAQPPYLVALSHIKELRNTKDFNRAILRWEPETIVQLPDGVAVLEFMVPGSNELQENNVAALKDHRIVVWSKHGIMVRSDTGALDAVDKMEYAEAGAMYEYRNRTMGNCGEGLTEDELRAVIADFGVQTSLY